MERIREKDQGKPRLFTLLGKTADWRGGEWTLWSTPCDGFQVDGGRVRTG